MPACGVENELWVPVERLRPIFARYTDPVMCLRSSTQRRLTAARNGEQKYVGLNTVDKMLIDMGLEHWLRVSKEDGGLADIYYDGAQYGRPENSPPPPQKGYESQVERDDARRATKRRFYHKNRADKVAVRCWGCGKERMVSVAWAETSPNSVCRRCNNEAAVHARRVQMREAA